MNTKSEGENKSVILLVIVRRKLIGFAKWYSYGIQKFELSYQTRMKSAMEHLRTNSVRAETIIRRLKKSCDRGKYTLAG